MFEFWSRLRAGFADFVVGLKLAPIWSALGWDQTVGRFKRTLLGPFWLSSGLLALSIALSFVFGGLLGTAWQTNFPMVLLGVLAWVLVGNTLGEAGGVYINAASLMQLQKLPLTFPVFLHMYRALVNFLAQLVTAVVVMLLLGMFRIPNWSIIPGVAIVFVNSFMLSLILAIPSTRFRDLGHALALVVQVMFFCTPIFWHIDQMSPQRRFIIGLNPLAHEIEVIRGPLMGYLPALLDWEWVIGTAVVSTFVAWVMLSLSRKRIVFWL